MKTVSILAVRDEADILDAHLAFHWNAGVDLTIAADYGSHEWTAEILEAYAGEGQALHIPAHAGEPEPEWRTRMARLAATEHGADWVISADTDEFWWPRGESLKDVLAAIPPRYGVVQGLVRVFPPGGSDNEFFAERMTARPSLLRPDDDDRRPLPCALRPIYRAAVNLVVDPADPTEGGRRVPLRAWYPIEVLRFPFRSIEQAERTCALGTTTARSAVETAAHEAYRNGRLREWYDEAATPAHLVQDERLRDVLRTLRTPDQAGPTRRFALPSELAEPLVLRVPDVVEDASYAGECAAVGEVDLEGIERQIVSLEGRISWLEERFWPRVLRKLSHIVRR